MTRKHSYLWDLLAEHGGQIATMEYNEIMSDLHNLSWKNLDRGEKPADKQLCLVWDEKLDWALAGYSESLDCFFGQFHGYNPRWWMKLAVPEELE